MNYLKAKAWLYSLGQRMDGHNLSKIKRLVKHSNIDLGKLMAIHIAGSNGKGSTCAFVAQILQEEGYKVGLYTSPHLIKPTERIKVNGESISWKKFAKLAAYYKKIVEKHKIKASYFEVNTAMAFKHFLDEKVDFAVIEAGMGGRLDATNVMMPLVSVITSISFEHTQYLGETIEKIAAEKAGIIKEGIPVVFACNNAGGKVIQGVARKKRSDVVVAKWKAEKANNHSQKFGLLLPLKMGSLETRMLGSYQVENAAVAVAAVNALRQQGIKVSEEAIRKGVRKTIWPGRLEIVRKRPLVVLDAAHNPDGWEKLCEALKLFRYKKLTIVFGAMKDKDIAGAKKLLSGADKLILTKAGIPRAERPEKIRQIICSGETSETVATAILQAMQGAARKDMVLVTGSIYLIGEAYRALKMRPR